MGGVADTAHVETVIAAPRPLVPANALVAVTAPRPLTIPIVIANLQPPPFKTPFRPKCSTRSGAWGRSRAGDTSWDRMPCLATPVSFSISWIWRAVANVTGEQRHILVSLSADVTIPAGFVPVPGSIQYDKRYLTGSATITAITGGWGGRTFELIWSDGSTARVVSNSSLSLQGNFLGTAGAVLDLTYIEQNTAWYEVSRTPRTIGSSSLPGLLQTDGATIANTLGVISLALGNANTWTANQTVSNASLVVTGNGTDPTTTTAPVIAMYESGGVGYIDSLAFGVGWKPMVLRANTLSVLSAGSTQGLYQASNGNVGIGATTTPYALTINGTVSATSFNVGGAAGASRCTGTPTSSFAVTNGIVTHC